MAVRNIEQDAAPERSVTGESAATEVAALAEDTAIAEMTFVSVEETVATEAATITPEQEQKEEHADKTDSVDNTEKTGDLDPANDADTTQVDENAETEQSMDTVAPPPKRSNGAWLSVKTKDAIHDVMDTCESVVIAMFTVLLIFTYLFSVAEVDGDSMLPTLHDEDRLLLLNLADPEPGDIVVLNSQVAYTFDENGELQSGEGLGKRIVKRLIATENQTVDIDFAAGIVYVDGEPLSEPYTSTLTTRDEGAFSYPITVPEGYVFVLGDNRSISKDSRHPDVALIPEDDILGKVWLRVYPLNDFMVLN